MVKKASVNYFNDYLKPHLNVNEPLALAPTSALIDSFSEENDLTSEFPRVLYNERETHPRDLPPEFVSNYPIAQSKVLKWLEWQDMMSRRSKLHIPEFYAGSILRVDYADKYATDGWLPFTFLGH